MNRTIARILGQGAYKGVPSLCWLRRHGATSSIGRMGSLMRRRLSIKDYRAAAEAFNGQPIEVVHEDLHKAARAVRKKNAKQRRQAMLEAQQDIQNKVDALKLKPERKPFWQLLHAATAA